MKSIVRIFIQLLRGPRIYDPESGKMCRVHKSYWYYVGPDVNNDWKRVWIKDPSGDYLPPNDYGGPHAWSENPNEPPYSCFLKFKAMPWMIHSLVKKHINKDIFVKRTIREIDREIDLENAY